MTSLFATSDSPMQVSDFEIPCHDEMNAEVESHSQAWGFDFVLEQPRPDSEYLWTKVDYPKLNLDKMKST